MIKCEHCGAPIHRGRYCEYCGTPLPYELHEQVYDRRNVARFTKTYSIPRGRVTPERVDAVSDEAVKYILDSLKHCVAIYTNYDPIKDEVVVTYSVEAILPHPRIKRGL